VRSLCAFGGEGEHLGSERGTHTRRGITGATAGSWRAAPALATLEPADRSTFLFANQTVRCRPGHPMVKTGVRAWITVETLDRLDRVACAARRESALTESLTENGRGTGGPQDNSRTESTKLYDSEQHHRTKGERTDDTPRASNPRVGGSNPSGRTTINRRSRRSAAQTGHAGPRHGGGGSTRLVNLRV
jgi:hypothetical protein